MKRLFLFNPEHDLALANGDNHFIAPKSIREMARDLSHIPYWIAGDCDQAVVTDDNFQQHITSCHTHQPCQEPPTHLIPWGWDNAIVERFKKLGFPVDSLPDKQQLEALRKHSERQQAHQLLRSFRETFPQGPYVGESAILRTIEEIETYATLHKHIVLKVPLSSSGKGIRHLTGPLDAKKAEWCLASIRRHRYIIGEPFYHKTEDFAMEYIVEGNTCQFIGYSLFATSAHGGYEKSILMSDNDIVKHLAHYVPQEHLDAIRGWIESHHRLIVPPEWDTAKHPIYFGIDMMIVASTDGNYKIHPCVEINLRMNMGIVAHEITRLHIAPHSKGVFTIAFFADSATLRQFSDDTAKANPSTYHEGKIVKGYLPLTPITEQTRHHAYIICHTEQTDTPE